MENMTELKAFDATQFAAWLESRLRQFYQGNELEREQAFDFRSLGILGGESHIDALRDLFEQLPEAAREQFRHALGQVLRRARPDDFPGEALADIVLLTGLAKAYAVFKAFAPVLGNGPWGEVKPSLLYDALSVLLMFDRSEEAYQAVKALATSVHFIDAFAYDAYLLMIRCRPENWRLDWELLRARLFRFRQEIMASGNTKKLQALKRRETSFAKSIAKAIPLECLGEELAQLIVLAPDTPNDAWLLKELCHADNGPLAISYNDEDWFLVDRQDPARKARIGRLSSELEVFCISNGLIAETLADSKEALFNHDPSSKKWFMRLRNIVSDKLENLPAKLSCSFPIKQEA
jgi:hypothetical protein